MKIHVYVSKSFDKVAKNYCSFDFHAFLLLHCHLITVVDEDKRKKINMVREVVKSARGYLMQMRLVSPIAPR